jgi:hypothetical protein
MMKTTAAVALIARGDEFSITQLEDELDFKGERDVTGQYLYQQGHVQIHRLP